MARVQSAEKTKRDARATGQPHAALGAAGVRAHSTAPRVQCSKESVGKSHFFPFINSRLEHV